MKHQNRFGHDQPSIEASSRFFGLTCPRPCPDLPSDSAAAAKGDRWGGSRASAASGAPRSAGNPQRSAAPLLPRWRAAEGSRGRAARGPRGWGWRRWRLWRGKCRFRSSARWLAWNCEIASRTSSKLKGNLSQRSCLFLTGEIHRYLTKKRKKTKCVHRNLSKHLWYCFLCEGEDTLIVHMHCTYCRDRWQRSVCEAHDHNKAQKRSQMNFYLKHTQPTDCTRQEKALKVRDMIHVKTKAHS